MLFDFLFKTIFIQVFFLLAGCLIVWRFVRFTILPAFNRYEPPELPYWIPFIGHAISYLRDSFATLTYGRNYYNDDRKPFSINLAGEVIYILTGPSDVTAAYRNNSSLTMDIFLQDMMRGFNISDDGCNRVFINPAADGSREDDLLSHNPKHKNLAHLLVDWFRLQLHPGPQLTLLGQVTMEYIEWATRWENMTAERFVLSSPASDTKDISVLHWCEDVLLRAAVRSFFGDVLTDQSPDLLEDFLDFDNVSWKLMYRYPKFMSRDMHSAKNKIVDAIQKYFRLPEEERPGCNWLVKIQETELRHLGVSERDMAKMQALVYWVINTNAYKLLFWMISFLLHDKKLVERVTDELQASFRPDGTLDLASLQTQTPYLTALFHETMRVSNSSASARYITEDTVIGNYTLKAGRKLLIPYRQLHLNKNVFGENAADFDISRFLNNEKLAKHPSYRPFGGGATYCPGSYFAKQELFMALAYLLCRHNVELAPMRNERFPRMDELKPGIGIIGPVGGDDVVMRVSLK